MNRAKSCRESHETCRITDRGAHDQRWASRSTLTIAAAMMVWVGVIDLLTVWYLTNQRANYSEMARKVHKGVTTRILSRSGVSHLSE